MGVGRLTGTLGSGRATVSTAGVERAQAERGAQLPAAVRSYMEPRFARDFSRVQVHAGRAAAEAAAALDARAFTLGRDMVFGVDQYNPYTHTGRRLIAHELAHVVQQGGKATLPQASLQISAPGDAGEREAEAAADMVMSGRAASPLHAAGAGVQRACGSELGEPAGACEPDDEAVIGQQFAFIVNCNDLQPGEAARVAAFAHGLRPGAKLRVHGYASEEGPAAFNLRLSCHRATVISDMLRRARPDCTVSAVLEHGAQSRPPSRDFWRSVIVEELNPQKEQGSENVCGPDATTWLLDQVAKAKTDPAVLAIQTRLTLARRVAAANGFSAEDITEGVVAKIALAEETRRGSPPRTGAASAQIGASARGQAAFGRALLAAPVPIAGAPEATVLVAIRSASLAWKALVRTGARYDFKSDSSTMRQPRSAHCPVKCENTITLCPETGASNCFQTDVPGNIFYAHVGRFVGFTELALQLGSQFAQLESTSSWDPPEDTAMIRTGWALPDPLDRAALCAAVASLRGDITWRACPNCSEATTAILR